MSTDDEALTEAEARGYRRGQDDLRAELATKPAMLAHDFPLRPSLMVRIVLPVALTIADAERVAGFVQSLVFKSETPEAS